MGGEKRNVSYSSLYCLPLFTLLQKGLFWNGHVEKDGLNSSSPVGKSLHNWEKLGRQYYQSIWSHTPAYTYPACVQMHQPHSRCTAFRVTYNFQFHITLGFKYNFAYFGHLETMTEEQFMWRNKTALDPKCSYSKVSKKAKNFEPKYH